MGIREKYLLNKLFIKMKIISILSRGERYFSELWSELSDFVGSKATFVKYLKNLLEKDVIEVRDKRVGNRVRRYYRLKNFDSVEFERSLERLKVAGDKIEIENLFSYINVVLYSIFSSLEEFGENWVFVFSFTMNLLLTIIGEKKEIIGEVEIEIVKKFFKITSPEEIEQIINLSKIFLRAIE